MDGNDPTVLVVRGYVHLSISRRSSRRSWASSNPKDARFLGTPLDFIVFDGLDEGEVRRIVFVEVRPAGRACCRGSAAAVTDRGGTSRVSLAAPARRRDQGWRRSTASGYRERRSLRVADAKASTPLMAEPWRWCWQANGSNS